MTRGPKLDKNNKLPEHVLQPCRVFTAKLFEALREEGFTPQVKMRHDVGVMKFTVYWPEDVREYERNRGLVANTFMVGAQETALKNEEEIDTEVQYWVDMAKVASRFREVRNEPDGGTEPGGPMEPRRA